MKRKILNLRIDVALLDPLDIKAELTRLTGIMVGDLCERGKAMGPVYDSAGTFLGLWKCFEGEEAPPLEMVTRGLRR